jgi:hypothetical protein
MWYDFLRIAQNLYVLQDYYYFVLTMKFTNIFLLYQNEINKKKTNIDIFIV